MTIVEIPGVGEVEFPDTMSDAEVAAAAKRLHAEGGAGRNLVASHATVAPPPPAQIGVPESGIRGALQGASLGFGDEAAAAIDAALPSFLRNAVSREAVGQGETYGERYRSARDYYRGRNAAAEEANPGTYLGGQFAGAVATPGAAAKGGRAILRAIGEGAAAGVGYSDADNAGDLASDTATGGAFGAAGHGLGKLVRTGAAKLARRGAERQALAAARAGSQAAEETAGRVASARGELGAEVQKGSRYVENLMRLDATMTPEQRALYAQLEASGAVPSLQRAVAQGTLERLPAQAGTIAEKRAALEALTAAAPDAVKARAAELLTPQVRADARSLFKSYGEPVIAATLGYKAADLAGADSETKAGAATVAGLLAGRTRAGKALRTRINRPAHQAAIGRAEQRIAESNAVEALARALRRGVPALATDAAVGE